MSTEELRAARSAIQFVIPPDMWTKEGYEKQINKLLGAWAEEYFKAREPCPHCGAELDGGDIYEAMRKKYDNETDAREAAAHYGATPESPKRFSKKIGVYDWDADRTTHYVCPECREIIKREEASSEETGATRFSSSGNRVQPEKPSIRRDKNAPRKRRKMHRVSKS